MQTLHHHLGRTYLLACFGEGPFLGRFIVKGEEDGHHAVTAWHELADEWPSAEAALQHAGTVARQYIATFAQQA
ncbi:hypothetical protein [Roseateles amylovorans]|jgi:hypothetical protein|uniref:Uncharacterized protein n=1 Tax=Roseateles amylovorans TaxID=2978473 RepID=A0ABY6B3S4_9BURK|nr:hypothetical protein [Roseateles amylovorans]UXH79199.1 hypothetical protein N4261_04475 [Roseateles amylovorans]